MKRLIVLILAGSLAACGTVQNPLNQTDLATAEAGYGVALSFAVAYRHLPLCKTGTTATLSNACAQRSVIVKLQQANSAVKSALKAARAPTVSAATMLVLQGALAAFQQIEANYGIGQ